MTRSRTHLHDALAATLRARESARTIRALTTPPPGSIDFSSNDFLSLASSPALRRLFLQELESGPPTPNLGSGGSRLLDGNSTYAETLERDIASFHRAEGGLLCNSGFDANVGLFSCLPQPGDVVVFDEFIHASVHDGMRVSRAGRKLPFAHNDPAALERVLRGVLESDPEVVCGRRSVFVAVEAVYSMDGDVAPLAEIVKVLHEVLPKGNGFLIVDEAHSNGVFGEQGRGLVCELGLEDEVLVRLHTFGKALACNGAILLCSPLVRSYLLNYARPLIYTTFLSYPALAAIRASYNFLSSGQTLPLTAALNQNLSTLHTSLLSLPSSPHLSLPPTPPTTPIYSLLTPRPKALAAYCQARGFVVRGIVPPTVPLGGERVRVCVHSGNTAEEIRGLVGVVGEWVREQVEVEVLERSEVARAKL